MHDILNTYIYQIPPTCFGACYGILAENIVLLSQKLYAYMVLLHSLCHRI
jgi:hypothetical protein